MGIAVKDGKRKEHRAVHLDLTNSPSNTDDSNSVSTILDTPSIDSNVKKKSKLSHPATPTDTLSSIADKFKESSNSSSKDICSEPGGPTIMKDDPDEFKPSDFFDEHRCLMSVFNCSAVSITNSAYGQFMAMSSRQPPTVVLTQKTLLPPPESDTSMLRIPPATPKLLTNSNVISVALMACGAILSLKSIRSLAPATSKVKNQERMNQTSMIGI